MVNIKCNLMVLLILSGTLYDGERFQLEFKFGSRYPFESPEVTFFSHFACILYQYTNCMNCHRFLCLEYFAINFNDYKQYNFLLSKTSLMFK